MPNLAIYEILGAVDVAGEPDESAAVRAATELRQFSADIQALLGADPATTTFAAQLADLRLAFSLARDVQASTGKSAGEAIGVVLAWKEGAAQTVALNARVTELEESGRTRDVDSLIKMGLASGAATGENPHAGKLTPALATHLRDELKLNAAQLAAFLEKKSREIPAPVKQPGATPEAFVKNGAGRVADSKGRTYEQIPPAESAELKKLDPELHAALRQDWVDAGKPDYVALTPPAAN